MGEFLQFCIGFCFFAYGIFSLMQNRNERTKEYIICILVGIILSGYAVCKIIGILG